MALYTLLATVNGQKITLDSTFCGALVCSEEWKAADSAVIIRTIQGFKPLTILRKTQ
jgi:hypothetical protein